MSNLFFPKLRQSYVNPEFLPDGHSQIKVRRNPPPLLKTSNSTKPREDGSLSQMSAQQRLHLKHLIFASEAWLWCKSKNSSGMMKLNIYALVQAQRCRGVLSSPFNSRWNCTWKLWAGCLTAEMRNSSAFYYCEQITKPPLWWTTPVHLHYAVKATSLFWGGGENGSPHS